MNSMTGRRISTPDDAWAAAAEDAKADAPMPEAEAEAIKRRAGRGNVDALREATENSGEKNDAA